MAPVGFLRIKEELLYYLAFVMRDKWCILNVPYLFSALFLKGMFTPKLHTKKTLKRQVSGAASVWLLSSLQEKKTKQMKQAHKHGCCHGHARSFCLPCFSSSFPLTCEADLQLLLSH